MFHLNTEDRMLHFIENSLKLTAPKKHVLQFYKLLNKVENQILTTTMSELIQVSWNLSAYL